LGKVTGEVEEGERQREGARERDGQGEEEGKGKEEGMEEKDEEEREDEEEQEEEGGLLVGKDSQRRRLRRRRGLLHTVSLDHASPGFHADDAQPRCQSCGGCTTVLEPLNRTVFVGPHRYTNEPGRGLHSFPCQLNLSLSVHRITPKELMNVSRSCSSLALT
jgi:hypothetical protein